jgi:hypothetical protein
VSLRIYKYPFPVNNTVVLDMPRGARILSVQAQRETPCIWALVDANEVALERRRFRIFGTGHPVDSYIGAFLGTFQLAHGDLVFHVFEQGAAAEPRREMATGAER